MPYTRLSDTLRTTCWYSIHDYLTPYTWLSATLYTTFSYSIHDFLTPYARLSDTLHMTIWHPIYCIVHYFLSKWCKCQKVIVCTNKSVRVVQYRVLSTELQHTATSCNTGWVCCSNTLQHAATQHERRVLSTEYSVWMCIEDLMWTECSSPFEVSTGEVGGWGRVPFSRNFIKPTPRRKWYLTTGHRFH